MTVGFDSIQYGTDVRTGLRVDDSKVYNNFGADAIVHLDLGSIAARNGESLKPLDQFLKDRGMSQADFPDRELALVAAERVGLQHYASYRHVPAQPPVVSDARNLCVLVSYPRDAEAEVNLAQAKI